MDFKNEVFIIGRVGREPEFKTFDNGGSITKLNIATQNNYKNRKTGEWEQETEWHQVIVKGTKAPEAQRLRKGDKVSLIGRLKTRSYESGGLKKYITEIHTYEVKVTGSQPGEIDAAQNNGDDDGFWNR